MATFLDPSITTSDNLSGQVVARKRDLPEIHNTVSIEVNLMEKMVAGDGEAPEKIQPLRKQRDVDVERGHRHLGRRDSKRREGPDGP